MTDIAGFGQQIKQDKWIRNLFDDMGEITKYLDDDKVTDIAIGKGGELIVEGLGTMSLNKLHALFTQVPQS